MQAECLRQVSFLEWNYVRVLGGALVLAGLFMIGFGVMENIYLICTFGFLFFAMLPFANNCLDYLVRTNISGELQGRAWGFIGFLSQIGYVFAYGFSGIIADAIGKNLGTGVGRGAAFVIQVSGVMLAIVAVIMVRIESIKKLENKSEQ